MFEELCTLLAAHFEPKPNAILQRYNFYSAYRTQGQPIKDCVAELNNLARNCEFGKTKPGVQLTEQLILEENLRDRLVCGVADTAVQRRLLSETDLDFAKAFHIALAMESATANAAQLCSTGQERSPEGAEVNKIMPHAHGQAARRSEPEPQYNAHTCFRCGDPSHSPNECRFRYAECRYCKKTEHIQSNCFTKKTEDKRRKGNRAHHMTPSDNYEAQHVAHEQPGATYNIFALTGSRLDPIVTTVCVDWKLLSMEIDTGATLSIISEETCNQHWSTPRPCLQGTRNTLRTYTGQCVKITGIADVTVVAKTGSKHVLPLMVVPGNGPSLPGRNWLSTLQLD